MKVLLASLNEHKLDEVRAIFAPGIEVVSPAEAGCIIDVVEDCDTFEANAEKKALEFLQECDMLVFADDSGLEVDALEGEPGVFSARYAGPECSYEKNNAKLLNELAGVDQDRRTARFRCAVACAKDNELLFTVNGTVEGRITTVPSGKSGFGYDPVFFHEGLGKTFGECTPEEKHEVSHRGKAFRKALLSLETFFSARAITELQCDHGVQVEHGEMKRAIKVVKKKKLKNQEGQEKKRQPFSCSSSQSSPCLRGGIELMATRRVTS